MSKETLGYMKLEWTCPRCNSRNPGPQKTCLSCGAPQPENVAFHLPEKQELIEDEHEIAEAKKGADIHCPYCGARNPADAQVCAQCGGSIAEGIKRQSGEVLGAFQPDAQVSPIFCPSCGAENDPQALKCAGCGAPLPRQYPEQTATPKKGKSKFGWVIAAAGLFLLLACGLFFVLASRTSGVEATVKDAYWQSSVVVESLRPIERADWSESIPDQATVLQCNPKVHHVQEEAVPNANKVCGTPYTVDTGGGYAEVVQDCVYEVLMDYCTYTVLEWQTVETLTQSGQDLPPVYAPFNPASDQRIGEQKVAYICVFDSSKGEFRYTTTDENFYRQCTPQSKWVLEINSFGQVVSAQVK